MRILLTGFLICITILSTSLIAYGELAESVIENYGIFVFVQIEIRNQDGQLIGYLEPGKIIIPDLNLLNSILDVDRESIQKSIVTINGKNYEMIKTVVSENHESDTVISKTLVSVREGDRSADLVIVDHDGYPVTKGDLVKTTWTFIRPV